MFALHAEGIMNTINLKQKLKDKIERVTRALLSKSWYYEYTWTSNEPNTQKTGTWEQPVQSRPEGRKIATWGQIPQSIPDAWTTAEIVHVLREISHRRLINANIPEAITNNALDFIIKEQYADGGWGLEKSSPPDTAFIIMVLGKTPEKYRTNIINGLNFLTNSKDGSGWSANQPEATTHVTSFIIDCLHSLHNSNIGPTTIQLSHLDPAREFLLKRQNRDGGWGEMSGSASDPRQTAYAIYALSRIYPNNENVLNATRRGLQWLKTKYNRKGFLGVGTGDIEATAIGVWALLASGESSNSRLIIKSIEYLINTSINNPTHNIIGWGERNIQT